MLGTVTLVVLLVGLTLISCYLNGKELLSPAILFPLVFLVSTLNGITNYTAWKFDLSFVTVAVIAGGSLLFCLTASIVHRLFLPHRPGKSIGKELTALYLPMGYYLIFCLYCLMLGVVTLSNIQTVSNQAGIHGSFLAVLSEFSDKSKHDTVNLALPLYVNVGNAICQAMGLALGYLVVRNYVARGKFHKTDLPLAAALICSALVSLSQGSRGAMLMLLIAVVADYMILHQLKDGVEISRQRWKSVAVLIVVCVAGILVFMGFAIIMGHTSDNLYRDFSIYLGAPIKNLDIYLTHPWKHRGMIGCTVFFGLYQSLHKIAPGSFPRYVINNPYHAINGHPLGNVHTTFYAFVYDFGYFGLVALTVIMALIVQVCYELVLVKRKNYSTSISFSVLCTLVSHLTPMVAFSFFSNKFYESVIKLGFLEFIVVWTVFFFFIEKRQCWGRRRLEIDN